MTNRSAPAAPPDDGSPDPIGDEHGHRLALAIELTDIGTWSVNLTTGEATHDARMAQILGVEASDPRNVAELWTQLVHPDDHPRVRAEFERATAGGGSSTPTVRRPVRRGCAWTGTGSSRSW